MVCLCFFCPSPFFPVPLLTQCDGCPDDYVWGLMAGLRGLPAVGECYCLGVRWSQWRPWEPFLHSPRPPNALGRGGMGTAENDQCAISSKEKMIFQENASYF